MFNVSGRVRLALALVILLVAELEYLLVTNYTFRTELRAALQMPVYHIVLAFLTLLGIRAWVCPARLKEVEVRFSPGWLLVHVLLYLTLLLKLPALRDTSLALGSGLAILVWICLGCGLLITWGLATFRARSQTLSGLVQENWPLLPVSVLAPYLAEYTSSWWESFAGVTFFATELFLQMGYQNVVSEPFNRLLGTTDFAITILPGCSGYEGMGLMGLLSCAYVVVKTRQPGSEIRLSSLAWIVPVSMFVAWLANIVRLVGLIVVGNEVSPSIAMRGFHSQAGWISFTLLSFSLIAYLEHRFRPKEPPVQDYSSDAGLSEFPGLPYLVPLMGVLLTGLFSASLSDGFEYLYGLKVLVAAILLWKFRRCYVHLVEKPGLESVVVGILVYGLWMALASSSGQSGSPFEALSPTQATGWVLLRLIGSVFVAPLTEELAFRGFLFRRVHAREFEFVSFQAPGWPALAVSSIFFGILHQEWLAGTMAGVAYGWVTHRSGGLSNAVVAHSVTNICLSVHVLISGEWGLW